MIVDWLLGAFQTVVTWAVSPLPSDNTDFVTAVNTVAQNLGALNYFLPISETVAVVVAVFALFPIFLGITLSLWVVAQLRGSSVVA